MTAFARPGMAAPVRVVRPVVDSFVRPVSVVAALIVGRVPPIASRCPEVVMTVLAPVGTAVLVRVVRRMVDSFGRRIGVVAVVVAGRVPPVGTPRLGWLR
jgi:hypothetical protein